MPRRHEYPGYHYQEGALPIIDPAAEPDLSNSAVPQVLDAFNRLRRIGDFCAFWDNAGGDKPFVPSPRYVTAQLFNHFQGVQRLRDSNYLVVSGGDQHAPASHLFIVEMKTREGMPLWGSNLLHGDKPQTPDTIVRTIALHDRLWHPGGMSTLGNVLTVPIEVTEGNESRILFLDMTDPLNPTKFPREIARPDGKCGAVALTRLPNDYFLCAAWSDSDRHPRRFDFCLSRSTNLHDGFRDDEVVSWFSSEVFDDTFGERDIDKLQGVNFVTDSQGGLYIVGFYNTSDVAPTKPGEDRAELFRVEFNARLYDPNPVLAKPRIERIGRKAFLGHGTLGSVEPHCNMDAASGLYIDDHGRLHVYSTNHWRNRNLTRFTEFRSWIEKDNDPNSRVTEINEAWVELYEHDNFRGRRLSVLGANDDTLIDDYMSVRAQGERFENIASSVRYQIPEGLLYRLYSRPNCQESTDRKRLDLRGSGFVEEIADLKDEKIGDTVSSSRYWQV